MTDALKNHIREMNRLAEAAERDGYRVWDLQVWEPTVPTSGPARKVCDLADYERITARDRQG